MGTMIFDGRRKVMVKNNPWLLALRCLSIIGLLLIFSNFSAHWNAEYQKFSSNGENIFSVNSNDLQINIQKSQKTNSLGLNSKKTVITSPTLFYVNHNFLKATHIRYSDNSSRLFCVLQGNFQQVDLLLDTPPPSSI